MRHALFDAVGRRGVGWGGWSTLIGSVYRPRLPRDGFLDQGTVGMHMYSILALYDK